MNGLYWGAPIFMQPKNNQTVIFLSSVRKLKSIIIRKPFPNPKLKYMLLNLEGSTHASYLYLNQGIITLSYILEPNRSVLLYTHG